VQVTAAGLLTRRAALGLLGAALGGCESTASVPIVSSLAGPSESPTAEGRMIQRYSRRDLDVAAMVREQDRVLRFQRAEAPCGLTYAPELHQYLDGVMHRIAARAPVPGIPARVVVVTSRDWTANSTPPGLVFIPIELLGHLDDEDQLAFLLAHELSHVLFRHHDSDWFVKSQKHALAMGELALAARTSIEGRRARSGPLSPVSFLAAQTAIVASDKIIAPAWTRTQEHQADLLGVDLLVASGYNKTAAVEVLRKMADWDKGAGRDYQAGPREAGEVAARPEPSRPAGASGRPAGSLSPELQRSLQSAAQSFQESLQSISRSHPEPEKRLELVQEYVHREYREAVPPDARVGPWRAARNRPQAREVFQNYARAFSARDQLRGRNAKQGEALARESLRGFTQNHNFPRYTMAQVYAQTGPVTRVVEQLRIAMDAPEPALETYLSLAIVQERTGRLQDALRTLEAGRQRFADHPRAWPALIHVYQRLGQRDAASQLLLRCQVEFPDFRQACQAAAKT
jgi:predicted Zn-dependent protease